MERKVNVIEDLNGKKIVVINDIRFRGKRKINWKDVENYLKQYIGEFFEVVETGDVERYNLFRLELLVRHDKDGKLYLYDIVNIKRETGTPLGYKE